MFQLRPHELAMPMTFSMIRTNGVRPLSSTKRGLEEVVVIPSHNPITRSNRYAELRHASKSLFNPDLHKFRRVYSQV